MIYDIYIVFYLYTYLKTHHICQHVFFDKSLRQDDDPEAFEDDAGRNSLWRGINPVGYTQRMIGGVYHVNYGKSQFLMGKSPINDNFQ